MPFERKEFPYTLKVGADVRSCPSVQQIADDMHREIDFVMIDTCNSLNFRDEKTIMSRQIALTRPGKVQPN